jgi:hypothetical protein
VSLPSYRMTSSILSNETPIGPPPGLTRGAVYSLDPASRQPFRRHMPGRTCFCGMRKSSMFADMPLDNRTVVQFAALTAVWLFQVFLRLYHRQNDLIFRRG